MFFQAFVLALREGMEAFLVLSIILQTLKKMRLQTLTKHVWLGLICACVSSLIFGYILFYISNDINMGLHSKLWEALISLCAVIMISFFILWMIKHNRFIQQSIEQNITKTISSKSIFLLTFFIIIREGVEIALFSFAGKYQIYPIMLGLVVAIIFIVLMHLSIMKINLKLLFNITLIYLILQVGYLFGYGVHELLSSIKDSILSDNHYLYIKAFDVSNTIFNHKIGFIGIPMNICFGWYSKPEWIQLVLQYGFTLLFILYYWKYSK